MGKGRLVAGFLTLRFVQPVNMLCKPVFLPRPAFILPAVRFNLVAKVKYGGGGRIRTFEVCDGRFTVCSLWPLGNPTRFLNYKVLDGAGYRNRTGDLLITSQLLYLLS